MHEGVVALGGRLLSGPGDGQDVIVARELDLPYGRPADVRYVWFPQRSTAGTPIAITGNAGFYEATLAGYAYVRADLGSASITMPAGLSEFDVSVPGGAGIRDTLLIRQLIASFSPGAYDNPNVFSRGRVVGSGTFSGAVFDRTTTYDGSVGGSRRAPVYEWGATATIGKQAAAPQQRVSDRLGIRGWRVVDTVTGGYPYSEWTGAWALVLVPGGPNDKGRSGGVRSFCPPTACGRPR